MAENLSNDYTTTLTSGIDAVTTSVPVASVTGAPALNFRIIIDSEIMLVTNIVVLTLTVIRNYEGSSAATHSNGADVAHSLTKDGLDNYAFENFTAFYPGAPASKTRLVKTSQQFNVFEELIIDNGGELIIDGGNINLMALP